MIWSLVTLSSPCVLLSPSLITYDTQSLLEPVKHERCSWGVGLVKGKHWQPIREAELWEVLGSGFWERRGRYSCNMRGSAACVLSGKRLTPAQRSPQSACDKQIAIWMTSCDEGLDCGICQRGSAAFVHGAQTNTAPSAHIHTHTHGPTPKLPGDTDLNNMH